METRSGRQCSKSLVVKTKFTMETTQSVLSALKTGRLHGLIRPTGRLFSCPHPPKLSEVPQLRELGLVVNLEKSHLEPSRSIIYLGVSDELSGFSGFSLPGETRPMPESGAGIPGETTMFGEGMDEFFWGLGTISSIEQFVSLGRLHLRPLQFYLNRNWKRKEQRLSDTFPISAEVKKDLIWWLDPAKLGEGVSLQQLNPQLILFSDASDLGWGATLGNREISGRWSETERNWHINKKELMAAFLALQAFEECVAGKVVEISMDNVTALAYVRKQGGTHSFSLNETAKNLLLWAKDRNIVLQTRFVQGELNVRADLLSRRNQVLPTEWTLKLEVCELLWRLWGQPSIDLFATNKTRRMQTFPAPTGARMPTSGSSRPRSS
ncbi:uncharacterized protein LOC135219920 [Macrobrachium nipponense]|uniref:uncharacterized protein LOC135219920 n=1 Tax=Macrobrachium nipponense TaxID=159736 RepID=UPI0030C81726